MSFDGSEATWAALDAACARARDALRVLEGMFLCRDDRRGPQRRRIAGA